MICIARVQRVLSGMSCEPGALPRVSVRRMRASATRLRCQAGEHLQDADVHGEVHGLGGGLLWRGRGRPAHGARQRAPARCAARGRPACRNGAGNTKAERRLQGRIRAATPQDCSSGRCARDRQQHTDALGASNLCGHAARTAWAGLQSRPCTAALRGAQRAGPRPARAPGAKQRTRCSVPRPTLPLPATGRTPPTPITVSSRSATTACAHGILHSVNPQHVLV